MVKVSRNDPCPCGSGQKYKKCCGKKEIEQRSKERGKVIEQLSQERGKLKVNKTVSIGDTIGTGLATLLANNLKLSDIGLPEKEKRQNSDMEVLPKLRDLFGDNIKVKPMRDGSVQFRTKGGIIILEP